MIFEEFLKDLRKELGVSQKELAERVGTSFQNISSYERHRTTCSVDMAMELLDALNVSVILENNQIKLKGEYENMKTNMNEKKYEKKDLDFINFSARIAYEEYKRYIKENEELSIKEISKATDKLVESGFEVYFSRIFSDRLWDADHYERLAPLVTITKGDREMILTTSGGTYIEIFLFEDFINDIMEGNPEEGAFIEKVLIFECFKNDKGHDIYDCLYNGKDLLNICPLLNGYEEIIMETINAGDYFYKLTENYDPRAMTISDRLGLFDCYSSNYPYFAFKMEDDEFVLAEESFEGHYIYDALNYAIDYFENDYDKYIEMYNDDYEREELVIL